jgi:hypothetical protein
VSQLAVELMLAQTSENRLIEDVTVNRDWIAVRRGPDRLPTTGFRLSNYYSDAFGMVKRSPTAGRRA